MGETLTEAPRYVLKAKAYIPRVPGGDILVLEAGTEITYLGTPGPHMEPLNAAARTAFDLSGAADKSLDPFGSVPVGKAEDDATRMAELITKGINEGMAGVMQGMAAMFAQALAAQGGNQTANTGVLPPPRAAPVKTK